MINIGILLDVCGIAYSGTQLLKLETLVNNLIKKLLEKNSSNPDPLNISDDHIKQEFVEENLLEIKDDLFNEPIENPLEIKDNVPNEPDENTLEIMDMSSDTTSTQRSITKRELLRCLHKKGSTPLKPKANSYATDVENFLLQRFRISPDSDEAGIIHAKSAKFSFAAREKWKKCRSGMIDRLLKKNTGKEPI